MQRRDFLKAAAAAGAASRPPNFLFLIADDLTWRGIHTLNNPEIRTPNLDLLAARGCAFTTCFHQGSWSGAVCVASRTMLNSGLSAFHAQPRSETSPLWGETMGAAGYDTAIVGKWHLSQTALRRSFKEIGPVSGGMFESGPAAYHRPSPGNTWTPWDRTLKGQWLHTAEWQKAARDEIKHSAQIWAEAAAESLRRRRGQTHPFFLYVGFNSPHDPRQAPKEYCDLYPRERMEIPPNYLPEHPFDQGDRDIRDEILAPFPRTREAVQLHRSEYYAHVTYMDAQIGRVLADAGPVRARAQHLRHLHGRPRAGGGPARANGQAEPLRPQHPHAAADLGSGDSARAACASTWCTSTVCSRPRASWPA